MDRRPDAARRGDGAAEVVRRGLVCGAVLAALALPVCAQQTIWQIGQFDDSSREFHDSFGVDYAKATSDVEYVVGRSTARDWLRFQPGPANGQAGGRLHPFRIEFALKEPPRGTYVLKLAMLYETPRLSALRVEVNGHAGLFTFAPKLDYAAGDWEGTFVPQTSHAERSIEIPAAWLREGENTVHADGHRSTGRTAEFVWAILRRVRVGWCMTRWRWSRGRRSLMLRAR